MDKDKIISLLKQINYPGYNRDIVSFGILSDLQISNNVIQLKLNLQADAKITNSICESIKSILNEENNNFEVNIDIISKSNQANVTGEIKTLSKVKNIIAVASGKGGVGKSTSTVNLATSLSKNLKVGILDLDIYGPSLQMALGCYEKPVMNAGNLLQPIEKYGMKLMSFGFLNDESAPTIWRGPMVSRMTEQFFAQVEWGELDILFLDLPPGTGDIQLTLVQKVALSGAVIITTPQDLALLDVQKASDMFNKLNTPILGVIENMSNLHLEGKVYDSNQNLINGHINFDGKDYNISNGEFSLDLEIFKGKGGDNESTRLNVPLLSRIPLSSELATSTDEGTPYVIKHNNTYIKSCYDKVGKKISEQLGINID